MNRFHRWIWEGRQALMKLRKEPVCPAWKPIYADRMNRVKIWSKFTSKAYWIVELED